MDHQYQDLMSIECRPKTLPMESEASYSDNGDIADHENSHGPTTPIKKISMISAPDSVDSGISGEKSEDSIAIDANGEDEVDCYKTRESSILQQYYHKLMVAMEPEILDLSAKLFSEKIIHHETKSTVIDSNHLPDKSKCAYVLKDIEHTVMLQPQFLSKCIEFFEREGSDSLRELSTEMRGMLHSPLSHSISENSPMSQPKRKPLCFRAIASSPAAFTPELGSMCEHCEFQHRTLSSILQKLCGDNLISTLKLTDSETEDENDELDIEYTPENNDEPVHIGEGSLYPEHHSMPSDVASSTGTLTMGSLPLSSLTTSTPLTSLDSKPNQLHPALFQAQTSMSRQFSYDSVCSAGGDEHLAELTSEFLDKLKLFYKKQKQSKKKVISEKKLVTEKLNRTQEQLRELSTQRSSTEHELNEANEKIATLEQSLDTAQTRNFQLVREILQYKRQLKTEKCVNGNSVDCKHFVRCSSLEDENATLKKKVRRLEQKCLERQARIENLDAQITQLLD